MSNYTMAPVVNGEKKQMIVKVGDTLPIGAEVDYEGSVVPNGWEEVAGIETGAVTWNTTNVTGDSNKNTWYKIGNIVIAILEFTPLSGKIANNNIICSGLPPAKAIFPYEEESRQYIVNQVGNCMWYYPTNTTNLNRIDTTIVYVAD